MTAATKTTTPRKGSAQQKLIVAAATRGLVKTEGGPLDGRWYFSDDLDRLKRAEEWAGRGWHYTATGQLVGHPTIPNSVGYVHAYTGGGR